MFIALVSTALVLFLARKPLKRAAKRQLRKTRKHLGKMSRRAMAKMARAFWTSVKALGREIRAQASWLGHKEGPARARPGLRAYDRKVSDA